jgi:hypothetical protein
MAPAVRMTASAVKTTANLEPCSFNTSFLACFGLYQEARGYRRTTHRATAGETLPLTAERASLHRALWGLP